MSTEPLDNELILNPKWWYLYGEAYDFTNFVNSHPGGYDAILLGQGRDCTALFESYHTRLPSKALLVKYRVNDDYEKLENNTFTYNENDFYRVVKNGSLKYFKDNKYSNTKGGVTQILLWLLNLAIFLMLCYYSQVVAIRGSSIIGILYGISKSLLVIRSTHSASHFALSKYSWINKMAYWVNMAVLGDTPKQWTAKHVIAHHIDTNIVPVDDDTMYPIKRVLTSYERYGYHHYQHIYIWLLYVFVYIPWSVSHNIKFIYGLFFSQDGIVKEGIINIRCVTWIDYIESLSCIIIHWIFRALPFIFLPTWSQAIIMSLIFELSSSVWFSLQFAVNHETEEAVLKSGFHTDIYGELRDFGVHQLVTSHNYSVGGWLALNLSGGLNYQIEHHLFPSVHHKHYPALSQIVQKAAQEFNLPYNESETFFIGIKKHYKLLKAMGQNDTPKTV